MSTPKIADLLTTIQQANNTIATPVETVHRTIAAGHQMRQQDARDALPGLKKQLTELTVPERLFALYATVSTAGTEAFLSANGGVVLSVDRFWLDLADQVQLGPDHMVRTTEHFILFRALENKGKDLEIGKTTVPDYREAICNTLPELAAWVRDRALSAGNTAHNYQFLLNQILEQVIAGDIDGKKIPVLIVGNTSPQEQASLSSLFAKTGAHHFDEDFVPKLNTITDLFRKL